MKRWLLFLLFFAGLVGLPQLYAQPANDNCAGAINIAVPVPAGCPSGAGTASVLATSNINATPSNPYPYLTTCNPGGAMGTLQNDVWYSFTATGYQAVINVNGSLTGVNLALWSGACGSLTAEGCATTAGTNVTLTVEQLTVGATYYIQVSGSGGSTGNFNLSVTNNIDCADCMTSSVITANPPPINGTYQPGQSVQFCFHPTQYNEINTNWFHGVQLTVGNCWNLSTLTPSAVTSWGGEGNWNYYAGGITDNQGSGWPAGWYFDRTVAPLGGGGAGDGNPGNNYGDEIENGTGIVPAGVWDFCFTIQANTGCNPGCDLSVVFSTSGDGESGSWTSLGCTDDAVNTYFANGSCCPPTMTFSAVICPGASTGSATATPVGGSGPYDYSWAGPSGYSSSTMNAPGANTVTGLAAGTYTVTITDALNCQSTNTVTVTQSPPPPFTAGNNGPLCAGATLNLTTTAVGGATYSWTGPGAFTSALQNPTRPGVTTAMAGTYTVVATFGGGCTVSSTTTVTINPGPVATAANTGPYCVGQTIQLNSTGGGSYSWTGPGGFANATQNPTRPGATTAMGGTYTVTVTGAGGCTASATTNVVVNPPPTPTASNTGPYCVGQTIQLNATGGGTYSWAGPGGYTNATQNPTRPGSTTAMAGTYTVTVTSAAGCTATATTTVTVNPLPAPTASNTGPYCVGQTIQLNATGGGTYSWAGPGGYTNATQNPTRPGSTTAMAGTYTVTVTSAAGCTATATTTVTVNPLPAPTASNTGPYCVGQTIQLNATGGGTYSWAGPGGYTNATQNPARPGSTAAMAGTYTVTVTSAAGCTATATTTVTVNPLPAPTASNTGPYCVGQTIQLNATGGGTYSWAGPGGYTNATQNPAISPAAAGNAGTYTVTVTSAAGCTATATTTVTVNPLPTPTASNTGPYCAGATIQMNSTGGGTYSWSGPGGYTNATQNPTRPGATGAMGGLYTVTVTSAAGCTATATTTVTINPVPAPTASNTGPYCVGATIQLNATGGGTYSWNGPAGYSNATQNPTIAASTVAMSGTYTVTVTDASGCTATATTTVTVNPLPAATASNTGPYCQGATIQLNSTGGGTYLWGGPSGYANATQNPTISPAAPGNAGTYTVTVTSAAGCTASATTTVAVNSAVVVTAGSNSPVCQGQALNLTVTTIAGGTYLWNGPGGYTDATQNPSINPAAPANSGTYTVTVTDAGGCTGSSTVSVTVNPVPVPTASNTGPYCAGTTIQLNATGGGTYSWSGPAGYSNATQNPTIAASTTAMSGTYTVTVTNADGCTATATTTVTVNPLPAPTASSTGPYCEGAAIQLNSTGGGTYSWSGPAGYTNATQNPTIAASTVAMSGTYTVTVTTAAGCTATATTTVTVNPNPVPTASNTGSYCAGATIQLNSTGGGTYSWSGPAGYTNATQNPTIAASTVAMSGTYTVTVTNASGCTATATTTVTVNPLPTPTASNAGPYCAGATIQLNSTGGGTYSWSGPGGYSDATQNPSIPTSITAMSGTYTVTVTTAAGCTATATTTVTVNPNPVPTASNTGPYCAGATIQLNSTGGGTYSWNGPAGYTNATQNPTIAASTTAMSGTYTVTATGVGGCTTTATTTVTVNPLPTPTASNTGPYCAGQTIQLNSTGGGTYSWSGPGGYSDATQNPSIPTSATAMSGTYTVTVTTAAGCTATATTTVTVNPMPAPVASNTGPYCAGQTIQLNSGGGAAYSWSGPGGYTNATQNPAITPAAVANSGTYTVTVTAIGGCTATATTTVTVNPLPTPTASNTGPYCAGATIQLNSTGGTGYSWTGPNAYTNGTQNPTIAPAAAANAGTYTVTVTDANNCSATATTTVTVNPLPTPTASNTGPYCAGATIQLNSTGGGTYSWSGPGGYSDATQNPTITPAAVANSGTYTVTVTTAAGCTAAATTTVTVNALPTPTASNTGPYCAGATIQLNSSGGTGYSWAGPAAYSNATQNPTIPSSTTGMSGTYTVTVTATGGCTATATTTVTVNPLPTPTASNTGPYCAGTTIQLNSTGGTGYSWTGPNTYSNATQNPAITPAAVVNSGTYTVTVTDANNCSATATTTVTVNPLPLPAASNTGPYCAGATIQLNSAGGTGYSWAGPNAYSNATQNPAITPAAVANSGTYTVTVTDANNCSATATTTVTVNALPPATASNTGPYCAGTTIQLNSSGGTGYSWNGPNAYSNATQNPTISPAAVVNSGTYTVTVTDANNCSATATTTVTVNPLPVPTASNTGPYCAGVTIQLNSSGGTGYSWAGPNAYGNATQNPAISPAAVVNSGTYTVTVTSAAGCTATATTSVTVNPLPVATAGSNSPICEGANLNLTSSGGTGYSWAGPNTYASAVQNPNITGAAPVNSGTYTVTVTDGNGCSNTATVSVTVYPTPSVNFTADDLNGCAPLCVNFSDLTTITGGTVTAWDWEANGTDFSSQQNPAECFNTPGSYDITLSVTTADGCTATQTLNNFLQVYANPVAAFTVNSTQVSESEPLIVMTDASTGASSWNWDFGDGSGSTQQNPTHAYGDSGTYCITLTVSTNQGCTDSDNICIDVIPEFSIYIPNTFTPNGDKINDIFFVHGRGIKELRMEIYDRWGEQIYTTGSQAIGWPGFMRDTNEPAKQDVYVYKIYVKNFKNEDSSYTGHINLIR